MNYILVPFKNFKQAKSRLRKDLSDSETEKIAKLMLEDVLSEVSKSKIADRKFLLTKDSNAISLGVKYGIEIIPTPRFLIILETSSKKGSTSKKSRY